jgi:hypothetical protein
MQVSSVILLATRPDGSQQWPKHVKTKLVPIVVVLLQVFSEYFCFPCQCSFHQILHPHNHPGQVQ